MKLHLVYVLNMQGEQFSNNWVFPFKDAIATSQPVLLSLAESYGLVSISSSQFLSHVGVNNPYAVANFSLDFATVTGIAYTNHRREAEGGSGLLVLHKL